MTTNSISIPILIGGESGKDVETLGLIDSGAGGKFIDRNYAKKEGLPIKELPEPVTARNVDGTKNKTGTITQYVELPLKIHGRTRVTQLLITGLGKQRIILGFPWLNEHNPDINWQTGEFKWRPRTTFKIKRTNLHPLDLAHQLARQAIKQAEEKDTEVCLTTVEGEPLLIKRHSEEAHIPTKGTPEAAGYDLYSAEEKVIPAHGKALIDTQISVRVPTGTYGRIAPRSGLALKSMIATGAGVIDSDYRGIVFVLLFNHSSQDVKIGKGDRMAQLILEKIDSPKIEEVDELIATDRDDKGFGSTGGYTATEGSTDKRETLIAMIEELQEDDNIWINTKTSNSIEFHLQHDERKEDIPLTEQIPKDYHEFLDVFDEKKADRFPESRPWDHKIELKEGFQPKSFKSYNLTGEEQEELDRFLKDNLDKGYIRPSQSPMATPFFFVKKKDGKLRPCQDYRYLNEWTVKNAYPLPLISELMDKVKDAKYFTKLDIRWGYNNVRIRDGDQWKAAFKTNRGLFEPTIMFFGMCNSPATFQAMMDDTFQDLIGEEIVIIYMDDIFLYAKDKETLRINTKRVLQRLQDNDLYLKPKKCEFEKTKIEWLGMVIEEGRIAMDSGKVKGIEEWPIPTTVKQVRGFLGFGNFYRRFIRRFSEIARPLNELLKKDRKFEWTDECQKAFDALKRQFTREPVLMTPDQTRPFQVECDASKYASGAVLTQLDTNGDQHPCAFISKTFSPAERNYEIYDRELLAIIRALEEWRHYIQGSPHTTIVYSDHKNLTYFREARKLNRRQARWSLYLSEFDVKLVHMAGAKMIQSDALSRRPDFVPEEDTDNEDVILLPDELFVQLIDTNLQNRILDCEKMDSDAMEALKVLLETGPSNITR